MILQPPQVSDVFTPLRQRDLVDGLNNAGNISGDGVETLPTGRGVGIISRRPVLAQRLVIVRIMSPAAGGGKYIGRIMNLPDDDVTEDGNLVEADIGVAPLHDDALVLNAQELNRSTHDLTTSPIATYHFIGVIVSYNSDNQYVVMINGIDLEDDCPPP
jgi:hypothetical protein